MIILSPAPANSMLWVGRAGGESGSLHRVYYLLGTVKGRPKKALRCDRMGWRVNEQYKRNLI